MILKSIDVDMYWVIIIVENMQGSDDTIKALNEAVKNSDHNKIY